MLATLMAALDLAPMGGEAKGARLIAGTLARLDGDGSAELLVNGKALSLQIRPEAMARAASALGQKVTLQIQPGADGAVTARFIAGAAIADAGYADAGAGASAAAPARAGAHHTQALPAAGATPQPEADAAASPAPSLSPAARAALAQAVARASAGQSDIGRLFASLQGLEQSGQTATLPPRLQQAVAQLLSLRLDPPDLSEPPRALGAALQEAVARAGLGHEARLATGAPAQAALAAGDLKSGLLALVSALAGLAKPAEASATQRQPAGLAQGETPSPVQPSAPSPPPHREATPRGQQPLEPDAALAQARPEEVAATLAKQAEGALERLRLLQAASLPPEAGKPMADPAAAQAQRLHLELPMALPDGRTQMLPLTIERDGAGRQATAREALGWRVRFALDGEPLGAIHAIVTWRMRQIGVHVFAEREATRAVLRAAAPELRAHLDRAGVDSIDIDIAAGRPPEPRPLPGRFLDRVT